MAGHRQRHRYPQASRPLPEVGSIVQSLEAVRAKTMVYERDTKDIRNSFVTVADLLQFGLITENDLDKL